MRRAVRRTSIDRTMGGLAIHHPGRSLSNVAGLLCVSLLATVSACGDAEELGSVRFPDASAPPNDDAVVEPASANAVVREDFNNTAWVFEFDGVVHDINLGRLMLPTRVLPETFATGTVVYSSNEDATGLVEASSIEVSPGVTLDASDAVELRGAEDVVVRGRIIAGSGGVTIQAGRSIVVAGQIDSIGPVRLVVTHPAGQILIDGRIEARAGLGASPRDAPAIEILGRGETYISGEVRTSAAEGRTGGPITIDVYGDVIVDGGVLQTFAEPSARPGPLQVRTEAAIEVVRGALVGVSSPGAEPLGGDIALVAQRIRIGPTSGVLGGRGLERGAKVSLLASENVTVEPGAQLQSGAGSEAGSLSIEAGVISIGQYAVIQAGRAGRRAGITRLEAAEIVSIDVGALVGASSTTCGPGGDLELSVSGPLIVADGAQLKAGGTISLARTSACGRGFPGGQIRVNARQTEGLQAGLQPGVGFPTGNVAVVIDPAVEVSAPSVSTQVGGSVLSRPIDRGVDAIGFAPTLTDLIAETPPRTTIEIGLAGSDTAAGPFTAWVDASTATGDLSALSDFRFVRYRVSLFGRAFDSPSVDYVELQLSSAEGDP